MVFSPCDLRFWHSELFDLYPYHLIVFDDIDWKYFGPFFGHHWPARLVRCFWVHCTDTVDFTTLLIFKFMLYRWFFLLNVYILGVLADRLSKFFQYGDGLRHLLWMISQLSQRYIWCYCRDNLCMDHYLKRYYYQIFMTLWMSQSQKNYVLGNTA